MENSRASKIILLADVMVSASMFFLMLHDSLRWWYLNPFILSVPLLRIWLSFLLRRKSTLAPVPIVVLMLFVAFTIWVVPHYTNMAFLLFVKPWVILFMKLSALFGVQVVELPQLQHFVNTMYDFTPVLSVIGCIWLIGVPLALFIYRACKKQLRPNALNVWKNIGLYAYLFATIILTAIVFAVSDTVVTGIFVLAIMLLHIPAFFYNCNYTQLLKRGEVAFMLTFAMFAVCYACALQLATSTIICVCLFPVAFYALVVWCHRGTPALSGLLSTAAASAIFCFAQYTTGALRIMLLMLSLVLMLIPAVQFFALSRCCWKTIGLYITMAFIIPILAIGYNPYSVLGAHRVKRFDGYSWATDGLLVVKSNKGYGLRDRYKTILPAEYDAFSVLTPSKPYCKVTQNGVHGIYDIERHCLVTAEWFTDVVPLGNYVYRLKSATGDKYLIMSSLYNRYGKTPQATITEELP